MVELKRGSKKTTFGSFGFVTSFFVFNCKGEFMKYIFVTGGVVSGLGKGITAASIGRLLKSRGLKVASSKLDPYINVDPGTMSPYQHGEVFVTEDGAEADLDLGHYERFIDENLDKYSNITTGKVYWNVLSKERRGEYLGETVQIIPHITNEIKDFIYSVGKSNFADVAIIEVGGTVGDIEAQPFIEAIRQVGLENECIYIHVTLVLTVPGSTELKSKPTQRSVKDLQMAGISPDIIVARCDDNLDEEIKNKISLFCNVKKTNVIENITVNDLYEAPLMLEKQNISEIICKELGIKTNKIDLNDWNKTVTKIYNAKKEVRVAIVGKYVKLHDAYLSVIEALKHGGYETGCKIDFKWIESSEITEDNVNELLSDVNGIVVPGGFGDRGIEGKILAAKFARENNVPYLGICLGMQIAAIEFAKNVLGIKEATSKEFNPSSKYTIIDYMEDQNDEINKGGTMRLGAYPCVIKEGSLLNRIYKALNISERHRHRYEFNNEYRNLFNENGMNIVGVSPDGKLVEAIENINCDFFIGVQYHPEFKSRPNNAHPLFKCFIESVKNR